MLHFGATETQSWSPKIPRWFVCVLKLPVSSRHCCCPRTPVLRPFFLLRILFYSDLLLDPIPFAFSPGYFPRVYFPWSSYLCSNPSNNHINFCPSSILVVLLHSLTHYLNHWRMCLPAFRFSLPMKCKPHEIQELLFILFTAISAQAEKNDYHIIGAQ